MLASCATHPLLVCGSLLYSFQSKILGANLVQNARAPLLIQPHRMGAKLLILAETEGFEPSIRLNSV